MLMSTVSEEGCGGGGVFLPAECWNLPSSLTAGFPAPSVGPSYTQRDWTTQGSMQRKSDHGVNMEKRQF